MFHLLEILHFDTTFFSFEMSGVFMMKVWSSDACGALAQPVGEHNGCKKMNNVLIATDFSDNLFTTSSPDHQMNLFIFSFS